MGAVYDYRCVMPLAKRRKGHATKRPKFFLSIWTNECGRTVTAGNICTPHPTKNRTTFKTRMKKG